MSKENRFKDLMGQVSKAKTEPTPTTGKVAKSKSDAHQKVTLYLTKSLVKRLKLAAVEDDTELSDMAEQALTDWLASRPDE